MKISVDVLIVGTGVSGLYSAINLNEDLKVLVISKSDLRDTNTYLAQGGISTARNANDIPLFIEDTLKAGAYENKLEAVEVLAKESIDSIHSLIGYGLSLDKSKGELSYTREGAHSINRIVHSKDETGKAVAEALIKEVKSRENIKILEYATLVDLLKENNKCVGGIVLKDDKSILVKAKKVILATGGIGGLFKNSTNRRTLTGDGVAIALKNNVGLKNLDYIQFHPTALYEGETNERRFLISEALRGEGALLFNLNGTRFVDELLPRDQVTAAILAEIKNSGSPYVLLDISFLEHNYIKNRFPKIYEECLKKGIDITKEPIPVSPAQHYFMGGIETDLLGRTDLDNLYAVGEVSCTGVHGANRLASNSLLEGLVFSKRAALSINTNIGNLDLINFPLASYSLELNKNLLIHELKRRSTKLYDELFCY